MNRVTTGDIRSLVYLISCSVVGAAIVGVFFGIGFLWLTDPDRAAPDADQVVAAQALKADRFASQEDNDTAGHSLPKFPAEPVGASPAPDTTSSLAALPLRSTAMAATLIRPAVVNHAKRVRVGRHHHQATGRYWAASWRSDASVGPNPGGGFYGPPNINIGYINPR
jgi:hypothetical protein